MATQDEKERLAVLEVKVDRQGKDITEVKGDVKTLLQKFDIVLGLRNEIDSLKVEIVNLKAASFRNKVVYPVLAAIIGGVSTALIIILVAGNK